MERACLYFKPHRGEARKKDAGGILFESLARWREINALGWLRPAIVSTRLAVFPCDGVARRPVDLLR